MTSPAKAANEISIVLRAALGSERFPIDVPSVALEISKYEEDPIQKVRGIDLEGFEGMLRASRKRPRWYILYNRETQYRGRVRFTQAHELGHYKLHRKRLTEADYATDSALFDNRDFRCTPLAPHKWRESEREREEEADTFASYLLMPIDDYREQVSAQEITRDLIQHITDRYGVSLTAAIRKWIEFTDKRAAMIVARDGFALWGRASTPALKSGVYIRSGMPIPEASIVAQGPSGPALKQNGAIELPAGVWSLEKVDEPVSELSFISTRLGLSITLLNFEDSGARFSVGEQHDEDAYEHLTRFN